MASITKRNTKSGTKWRVQIRRPGIKPIHHTARTKGEAEAWARATERELDLGKSVVARNMTIAQLIEFYRDRAGGEESLPKSKATSFRHIEKYLGSIQVRDLSNSEIVDFARKRRKLDKGRGQPLSPATIAMDVGYLSDLLEYGARNCNTPRRIEEMKLARIDLRKEKLVAKAKVVNRLPRGDEFDRMVAAAEKDTRLEMPLATILKVARATGMRESEICKIRWSDLDAASRVILVPLRKHPKQPRDKEMPLIPNHGIDPLAELESMRGWRRKGQADDDDRIFPFKPGSIGAAFRRIRKRLGLRPIRLHDLRHDAATSLARREGMHFKEAMVVLGHDDVASLARYSHFTASEVAQRHGDPQQSP